MTVTDTLRRLLSEATEQYPKVVGLDAREWKASAAPTEETPHE